MTKTLIPSKRLRKNFITMGTFIGHLVPGLALAILGLWHTINTIKSYCLKGSTKFTIRFWYPFDCPMLKFKHLELVLVLVFSLFAIFMQVLDYPYFHFVFELNNFEHATMFLHLAVFAGFTLFSDLTNSSEILSGIPGILVASLFSQELFLIHFHSADHVGLEGHYHWLLQLIVFVSLMAAISAASFPSNFPSAFVLSISVLFQGCWFVNMGFFLWLPKFIPQGCSSQLGDDGNSDMHGAVVCGSHEADFRAKAMANLQFSWILSGILIFSGCVCLVLARRCVLSKRQLIEYERLHSQGTDVTLAVDGFKQGYP